MKTVLIDNSLCVLTINDNAGSEDIAHYICALAEAGVKYVEIDFRALMKLRHLPDGIGYIFRPIDPMFMRFTEVFRFDYIALSVNEITKYSKIDAPVLFTLPLPGNYMTRSPREIVQCAENLVGGQVTSVRIRGDYPLMSAKDAAKYIDFLKKRISIPVDICPTNGRLTALNTAMSFFGHGADSITVTMGSSERYCSLEEMMTAFFTIYGGCPKDLDMTGLYKAVALHTRVFKSSIASDIPELVRVFEEDFSCLRNADTGERVLPAAPRRERRFSQTFADFVKGLRCELPPGGNDTLLREAADNFTASVYKPSGNKGRHLGGIPPFLN